MSKRQVLMLLGAWVMILFALGIPSSWKQILAILTGLVIVIVAYRLKPPDRPADGLPYVERKDNGMSDMNAS